MKCKDIIYCNANLSVYKLQSFVAFLSRITVYQMLIFTTFKGLDIAQVSQACHRCCSGSIPSVGVWQGSPKSVVLFGFSGFLQDERQKQQQQQQYIYIYIRALDNASITSIKLSQ